VDTSQRLATAPCTVANAVAFCLRSEARLQDVAASARPERAWVSWSDVMREVFVCGRALCHVLSLFALLLGTATSALAQITQVSTYSFSNESSGRFTTITPGPRTFSAQAGSDFGVSVVVTDTSASGIAPWTFTFVAPNDLPLTPGQYARAVQLGGVGRRPEDAGFSVTGSVWSCWYAVGEFTVLEIEYGVRGAVTRFSANLRIQCGSQGSVLVASVRFNASPRPAHRVSVSTAGTGGGPVVGIPRGLHCGANCSVLREEGLFTILEPTPATSSAFSWSGDADCSDGVILNGDTVSCAVTYEPCRVTLSQTALTFESIAGGQQRVELAANGPNCRWEARSAAPWISVTASQGKGPARVTLSVSAHTSSWRPRTGTVNIGGQLLTVTQQGPRPTYQLPSTLDVGPGGGTTNLVFTSNVPDPPWSAASQTPWVSVLASGGTTTVPVTVTRNPSATSARIGTIEVAGQTVQIIQRANAVPGEPTHVSVRVRAGRAQFIWRPPTTGGDATSYRIEAGLERGATAVVFAAASAPFDLVGVPDGRFFVRVRGVNEFGTGVASDDYVLEVRRGMNPPDPPINVRLSTSQNDRVSSMNLSWNEAEGGGVPDVYLIEVGSTPGTADFGQFAVGRATRFESPFFPGRLFISVRAGNGAGYGRASDQRLSGSATRLTQPLTLTASTIGSTVIFNWADGNPWDSATRFRLTVGRAPGVTEFVFDTADASPAAAFSGVPPGRYYVRVHGREGTFLGPASNEVYIHVR